MRSLKTSHTTLGLLAVSLLVLGNAAAEDIQSGLQVGDAVPPFKVIKKGGSDDGVPLDASLCYR